MTRWWCIGTFVAVVAFKVCDSRASTRADYVVDAPLANGSHGFYMYGEKNLLGRALNAPLYNVITNLSIAAPKCNLWSFYCGVANQSKALRDEWNHGAILLEFSQPDLGAKQ